MANDSKGRMLKILRDMIPVVLGVLIALLVNGWKEQVDDKRYLKRMFAAIDQEIDGNLDDVSTVMTKQVALLDTIAYYEENDTVAIAEILMRGNGLQSATIKSAAWRSLNSSRLELVDYEVIAILTEIEEHKETLNVKLNACLTFLFNNLHATSKEDKQTLAYHIYNLLDSGEALKKSHKGFQALRTE